MLFNSWVFAGFFACVFTAYAVLPHRRQNLLLLVASYVFYAAWDWRFLALLWASTLIDYTCGLLMSGTDVQRTRRRYLAVSLGANITILGFFKYYGFFTENLRVLLEALGLPASLGHVDIVLPVGLSFYTFQSMSYAVDVYRRQVQPTRNLLDFALFVAFFPQLVAGPIQRAGNLMPQVLSPRALTLQSFYEGSFLFFWGLIQKVFVADNLAKLVNPVFNAPPPYVGGSVLVATYAFAFQIYGDFAGYSNMARGVAKCLGFDMVQNFDLPYVSRNPAEFWRRWHISLSVWLRDYLFLPISFTLSRRLDGMRWLGFRDDFWIYAGATMLTMLLGGLWHGAAWTFVIWGGYQGILLVTHRALTTAVKARKRRGTGHTSAGRSRLSAAFAVVVMFHLTCVGWVLFRAPTLSQAWEMLAALAAGPAVHAGSGFRVLVTLTTPMVLVEAYQHWRGDVLAPLRLPTPVRAGIYVLGFYMLVIYGVNSGQEFIYFQF